MVSIRLYGFLWMPPRSRSRSRSRSLALYLLSLTILSLPSLSRNRPRIGSKPSQREIGFFNTDRFLSIYLSNCPTLCLPPPHHTPPPPQTPPPPLSLSESLSESLPRPSLLFCVCLSRFRLSFSSPPPPHHRQQNGMVATRGVRYAPFVCKLSLPLPLGAWGRRAHTPRLLPHSAAAPEQRSRCSNRAPPRSHSRATLPRIPAAVGIRRWSMPIAESTARDWRDPGKSGENRQTGDTGWGGAVDLVGGGMRAGRRWRNWCRWRRSGWGRSLGGPER